MNFKAGRWKMQVHRVSGRFEEITQQGPSLFDPQVGSHCPQAMTQDQLEIADTATTWNASAWDDSPMPSHRVDGDWIAPVLVLSICESVGGLNCGAGLTRVILS